MAEVPERASALPLVEVPVVRGQIVACPDEVTASTQKRGRQHVRGCQGTAGDPHRHCLLGVEVPTGEEQVRRVREARHPVSVVTKSSLVLRDIDILISRDTGIVTRVADDPLSAVVLGTMKVLEDLDRLRNLPGWIKSETLKSKLARIGEVNVGALDELRELLYFLVDTVLAPEEHDGDAAHPADSKVLVSLPIAAAH